MHDTTLLDNDTTFNFGDQNWRRFPQKKQEELGCTGNDLWNNKSAGAGALICPTSNRSDKIAVSQSGLEYLFAAVQRGDHITSGKVVFTHWDDKRHYSSILISMDVTDVYNKIKGVEPRQGKYGPFWLFYRDGTPEGDEDAPF
jgi:hypothetical protein